MATEPKAHTPFMRKKQMKEEYSRLLTNRFAQLLQKCQTEKNLKKPLVNSIKCLLDPKGAKVMEKNGCTLCWKSVDLKSTFDIWYGASQWNELLWGLNVIHHINSSLSLEDMCGRYTLTDDDLKIELKMDEALGGAAWYNVRETYL